MKVLPYLKATVLLLAIGIVLWLIFSVSLDIEPVTYVNQTNFPLRFVAIRVDNSRFLSQVVVPAHMEIVSQWPKNSLEIRVIATRSDGSTAFQQTYDKAELAKDHDRIVVMPMPIRPPE